VPAALLVISRKKSLLEMENRLYWSRDTIAATTAVELIYMLSS